MSNYLKIWKITALNALQETFVNRATNLLFLTGKIIRLTMSLLVLWLIKSQLSAFGNYSADDVVIFFLTYLFIDTLSQVIFRGVYLFSPLVRSGEFDFLLIKPISPLFRALTGRPDFNDALFIIPSTIISLYLVTKLDVNITLTSFLWYLLLLFNSLLISTSLHIMVLVIGVLTTEVDGVIWMYRDLTRMGQFPVNIYLEPIRTILFFLIPIGVMFTVPTQILINEPASVSLVITFLIGVTSLLVSYGLWRWSLKKYTSTGS